MAGREGCRHKGKSEKQEFVFVQMAAGNYFTAVVARDPLGKAVIFAGVMLCGLWDDAGEELLLPRSQRDQSWKFHKVGGREL